MTLKESIKERDEILLSMDVERAKSFIKKHGAPLPSGRINWEQVLHMARFEVTSIPEEDRIDSHIWLAQNVGASLATLPPDSKYVRVVLDLIFPRDDYEATMEAMRQPKPVWPRAGS